MISIARQIGCDVGFKAIFPIQRISVRPPSAKDRMARLITGIAGEINRIFHWPAALHFYLHFYFNNAITTTPIQLVGRTDGQADARD